MEADITHQNRSGTAPEYSRVHPPLITAPVLLLLLGLASVLLGGLALSPVAPRELAVYSTSLKGRTRNQRYNAELAARALDGRVIAPGAIFSFNRTVKSWSVDQGYVKALVSYDGELVRAYGGGVCQTSTTLYNTALLAGLPVVERHPHVFVPGYIPPGRDAAVAYPGVDLRFRNPHPYPLRIRARTRGDRLEIRLLGANGVLQSGVLLKQGEAVESLKARMESQVLAETQPARLTLVRKRSSRSGWSSGRTYVRSTGAKGYRVVTWRIFSRAGREVRRERLSDDTYPAMNHVVALTR